MSLVKVIYCKLCDEKMSFCVKRLIGLSKYTLYKSIGSFQLTYNELEEILLDVEINLNNRPLQKIKICTTM